MTLDQINPLLPKWLHYRPHFTKHYSSGKSYSVYSYWYVDFDYLKTIFGNQTVLDATIDAKSAKYTKRQFMLINKLFLFDKGKANKAKRLEKKRLERKAEKEEIMKNTRKSTDIQNQNGMNSIRPGNWLIRGNKRAKPSGRMSVLLTSAG